MFFLQLLLGIVTKNCVNNIRKGHTDKANSLLSDSLTLWLSPLLSPLSRHTSTHILKCCSLLGLVFVSKRFSSAHNYMLGVRKDEWVQKPHTCPYAHNSMYKQFELWLKDGLTLTSWTPSIFSLCLSSRSWLTSVSFRSNSLLQLWNFPGQKDSETEWLIEPVFISYGVHFRVPFFPKLRFPNSRKFLVIRCAIRRNTCSIGSIKYGCVYLLQRLI